MKKYKKSKSCLTTMAKINNMKTRDYVKFKMALDLLKGEKDEYRENEDICCIDFR